MPLTEYGDKQIQFIGKPDLEAQLTKGRPFSRRFEFKNLGLFIVPATQR